MLVPRLLSSLLLAGLVSLAAPAPAAAPAIDPQVLVPLKTMAAGMTAVSAAQVASAYTADATLVDEFPPFVWTGPGAASKWYAGFTAFSKQLGLTKPHAVVGAARFVHMDGTARAYAVVPMTFTFEVKGKPGTEHGDFVLVLVKSGGAWKMASSTWSKVSDTTEPAMGAGSM
jgi:hypothetical protein